MTNATEDEAQRLTSANALNLEVYHHSPDEQRAEGVKPCEGLWNHLESCMEYVPG